MSLVQSFAPHLPFLRRYARALTGSQDSGDAYIRASLQALVENPDIVEDSEDPRLSLYRFFHVIWGTTGAQLEGKAAASSDPADTRLQSLAPIQRQAFLLTALEGFSASEAAYILGISDDEQRMLEQDKKKGKRGKGKWMLRGNKTRKKRSKANWPRRSSSSRMSRSLRQT